MIFGSFGLAYALFLLNYFLPMTSLPWVACNAALAMTGISLLSLSVVGILVFRSGQWWLAVFRSHILIFFGLISYAFYMVHLYVIRAYDLRWTVPVAPQVRAYTVRFLVTFTASVAIATPVALPAGASRDATAALYPGAEAPGGVTQFRGFLTGRLHFLDRLSRLSKNARRE